MEQKYFQQVEQRQSDLRGFRHDYMNLLASMDKYIVEKDMAGLVAYFNTEIKPTAEWLEKQDIEIGNLGNILVKEIKSLLSAKLIEAQLAEIKITVEIPDEINQIYMKSVPLVRVLGNLLDNAIEALVDEKEKWLHFAFLDDEDENQLVIVIKNTFTAKEVNIKQLFERGYSTKETGSGLGLDVVAKIVGKLDWVTIETKIEEGYFTQVLKINKM